MTAVNMHDKDQKMSYLQNRADAVRSGDAAGEYKPALSEQEFGRTAYVAFRTACHASLSYPAVRSRKPLPAWEQLPEDAQEDWSQVATAAVKRIVEADGLPWDRLGTMIRNTLYAAHGMEPSAWDTLSARDRFVWEAVGRHLANMAVYEEGDDVQATEQELMWAQWIVKKLGPVHLCVDRNPEGGTVS